jgi:hypothetical protein
MDTPDAGHAPDPTASPSYHAREQLDGMSATLDRLADDAIWTLLLAAPTWSVSVRLADADLQRLAGLLEAAPVRPL